MSKVMIVEDDDSLREIYSIRLTAEGYAVISARDGEEALAVAVKERPDLIISDVMMPKISGFDMLDILRSTPETQNIKVIMMTALSSDDQRVRGENLGADRYLVKSQVGIEDVINVVHEVLGDRDAAGVIATTVATPASPAPSTSAPTTTMPAAPAAPVVPAPTAPIASTPSTPSTPSVPIVSAPAAPTVSASPVSAPNTPTVPTPTTPTAAPATTPTQPVVPVAPAVQDASAPNAG